MKLFKKKAIKIIHKFTNDDQLLTTISFKLGIILGGLFLFCVDSYFHTKPNQEIIKKMRQNNETYNHIRKNEGK